MGMNQPDFESLRIIRDNTSLLVIANEYLGEDIFLTKIGSSIEENVQILKDDIKSLKKQFPGKFLTEVNTENIIQSFEKTTESMLSSNNEIREDCSTGKLGITLNSDVAKITNAIEKIWIQVRGTDVEYTKRDSIGSFLSRINIFSGTWGILLGVGKILVACVLIVMIAFPFLFFTMEKDKTYLKENNESMGFIKEQNVLISEIEKKKAESQKNISVHDRKVLSRKDRISIINLETKIQQFNEEIYRIEGLIETRELAISKNNERLNILKEKSFLERLLRR